jgi:uncharacterized repeat protein (TIGR03843 family)
VELSDADLVPVLATGTIDVVGRVAWSSNAALLVTVTDGPTETLAVYKPQRGERPLWDFPDGTLCRRETASFVVSEALGWGIVPTTVLRDGPHGIGMLQRFVEHDPDDHYFTLLAEHEEEFLRFAVFDVVVNNADRKGGHCLRELASGRVFGIDHGLTFHVAPKLRTVIWDFAAARVPDELVADLASLRARLDGPLGDELAGLLHPVEVDATAARIDVLLRDGRLPSPDEGYHSVPWPLV